MRRYLPVLALGALLTLEGGSGAQNDPRVYDAPSDSLASIPLFDRLVSAIQEPIYEGCIILQRGTFSDGYKALREVVKVGGLDNPHIKEIYDAAQAQWGRFEELAAECRDGMQFARAERIAIEAFSAMGDARSAQGAVEWDRANR